MIKTLTFGKTKHQGKDRNSQFLECNLYKSDRRNY